MNAWRPDGINLTPWFQAVALKTFTTEDTELTERAFTPVFAFVPSVILTLKALLSCVHLWPRQLKTLIFAALF